MWALFVLTATFVVVSSAPTTTVTTPAYPNGIAQCARSECPEYTLLRDYGDNIVKRRIEPGRWAYKDAPTCNVTEATGLVYLPLHYYFADNNISRTTPIFLEITKNKARSSFCPDQLGTFPCCQQLFRLIFYIPQDSQLIAPQPAEESGVLLLDASQSRDFYVIDFSGRPTDENVVVNLEELIEFLEIDDLDYDDDTHIVATYDAPWRPEPHRNEILVPLKGGRPGGRGNGKTGGRNGNGEEVSNREGGRGRGRRDISGYDFANIDLIPF